jgi:hypothetical protein
MAGIIEGSGAPFVTVISAHFLWHLTFMKYLASNIFAGDRRHGFSASFEIAATAGSGGLFPQAWTGG